MIESQPGSIWFEIRNKIQGLHERQIIFCPLSFDHYIETAPKCFEDSKSHDSFLFNLSDGYCIKPEIFITPQLISSHIRKYNTTLKTYMYEGAEKVLNSKEAHSEFFENNKEFGKMIVSATSFINTIRHNRNNQKLSRNIKDTFLKLILGLEVQNFINRLEELNKTQSIIIRGEKFGDKEVPNWIDLIIDQLLKKHRFTRHEIQKLIYEFREFGFANIPILDIRFKLSALLGVYGKIENSSDHIDIRRISSGIPLSDYLFTDKKRKAEIIELKLHEKYNTKIFSGMRQDLEEFSKEMDMLFTQKVMGVGPIKH